MADFFRIAGPAFLITAGAAGIRVAFAAGTRYVMVQAASTDTVSARFEINQSNVSMQSTDAMLPLNGFPLFMNVQGFSDIAVLRGGAVDTPVLVTPVTPA
jgi:hypothetical protein